MNFTIIGLIIILTFSYQIFRKIIDKQYFIYIWSLFILGIFIFYPGAENLYQYSQSSSAFTILLIGLPAAALIARSSGYDIKISKKNVFNFALLFPIIEELLFRGIIFSLVASISNLNIGTFTLATLVSAASFGITHLQYHDFEFTDLAQRHILIAFIGGLFMGDLMDSTGFILYPILIHISFNSAAVFWSWRRP